MLIIWLVALAKLLFHIYFNNRYGYFRDEFDYISCGDHLAWGYVDQPPLIPFLIHINRAVLGDSLRSIRFIPALASSLLVVQTALIAREFGGRRFALLLSAIAIVIAPQFLSNGSLLGTNCLEPNLWMGCAYFAILAIKRAETDEKAPRCWLWFGVVAGVGMQEKYSIAVFGFGVVIGLLLTAQRRVFRNRWIWLGGLAAFLIFLPNLLWNLHYHWPFLELMRNIRAEGRDVVLPLPQFFLQQTLLLDPITAPIWLTGLFALLFSARLKPYRVLGWCYLACFTVFFVLHGKSYYLAPVYPMLLAAGAVAIESAINGKPIGEPANARPRRLWLKAVIVIVLLASGAHLAPITVPVLSPNGFLAYMKTLPFKLPVMEHSHARAALPQWYADQFGWEEIVAETALAWNHIPVADRKDCGIFAQDYGQAGAIDFLGGHYGLPPGLSGDRTYFLWGPRGYSGNCLIVLGDRGERLEQLFANVEYIGESSDNPYALETEISVNICRGPRFGTLTDLWPQVKHWR
ncbi:MAG TPA: glycosyltransferase family 39 protein [Candidatus Sulfotelmatobacter sp.]|jgi:4-amino-4-deoxy-L-arabinose transferase-like glycosyltransferase|nr:glycosyltransferase family 39 protein [Candidatus Sulfotelmatobacter sp.]